MKTFGLSSRIAVLALAVFALTIGPSLYADGGANHRVANTRFGVSGGNVNDITSRFCCSGTLGALVKAGGVNYILSNNHVLARGDQAAAGEDVSQPGRIDNNCALPPIVADFTTAPVLGSNVDAAIAQLRSGAMNTTGEIEDAGIPSAVVKAPTVGLAVVKSGRTTGFTSGTIGSINTSVNVQYQKNCGSGKKFVVSYTNQVVINSSTFSAGGDSGSLILSNDNPGCRHPVALLFAGSSSSTIGNPIGEVLTKLSTALGSTVSFVGSTCTAAPEIASLRAQAAEPSSPAVERATLAMRSRENDLMSRPGVIGVGVGASDNDPTAASIVVYVDANAPTFSNVPRRINGVRVKVVFTEPFVAY
jgi:Peptidase family S64